MKRQLIEKLLAHLNAELDMLRASAAVVAQAATHEESRPENKYDTRGLEASYLAGAQAARIRELAGTISQLANMKLKSFAPDDPIEVSALIELEHQDQISHYFLVPVGAGIRIEMNGMEIVTLTISSPMGKNLISKSVSDFVSLQTPQGAKEYEILSVK
jgi:transcription elongation GreA/GreB family factor